MIEQNRPEGFYENKLEKTARLAAIEGHPLHTFVRENKALSEIVSGLRDVMNQGGDMEGIVEKLCDVSLYYAKKGDLLYPHLKAEYGVAGPSDLLWTTDDEIRDEIIALRKSKDRDEKWMERFEKVLCEIEAMLFKENHVLYPNCAIYFSEEDWKGIYQDAKDYGVCFGVEPVLWQPGEDYRTSEQPGKNISGRNCSEEEGEIFMPGGHMTIPQLTALLNTIPLEITFIDGENINRFFNEGPKVFKRPLMALDREVFSCHPPKIEPMVRGIIEDFRSGKKDQVPIWMEKGGRTMLVTYMAVRDKKGNYLGTVELVQDMEFAKEYFLGR